MTQGSSRRQVLAALGTALGVPSVLSNPARGRRISTLATPAGTGTALDDFNDQNFDWSIIQGQRDDLEYSTDAPEGTHSLYFRDRNQSTVIAKQVDSAVQIQELSFWFKYDSANDNNLQLWVSGPNGPITQFRVFGKGVYYREPPDTKVNHLLTDIEQNTWYKGRFHEFDFSANTFTLTVETTDGTQLGRQQDIAFYDDVDGFQSVTIRNFLGDDNTADPAWFDDIRYWRSGDETATSTQRATSVQEESESQQTQTLSHSARSTASENVVFGSDEGGLETNLFVVLGVLGLGGGGTLWWLRGGADEGDTPEAKTASTDPSPDPDTRGPAATDPADGEPVPQHEPSGTAQQYSSAHTENTMAGSDVFATAKSELSRGDDARERAGDYLSAEQYQHAIDAYEDAREAYETAREVASENNLLDTETIEQKLAAVEDERHDVHRERLSEKLTALRSEFDDARTCAEQGELQMAQKRLADLESDLETLANNAADHEFDELHEEAMSLARQRAEQLETVTDRRKTRHIPEQIPTAPEVDIEYDTLTEETPLGGGGNADVTQAVLPTADGDVTLAIKKPRITNTLHADQVEQILTEAETWDKLDDHDHIVDVVGYGSEPLPWIAMEYMDGAHLGERTGEMDIPHALWTAIAITRGVRHAHRRGVAHLDLKPENVLFRTVEDAWDVPKVADWGLSKHLLEHSKSVEGLSPQYAAPEQFDDDYGSTDDLTDIYQLGALFYELFTGRPPFTGEMTKVMRAVMEDSPAPPSEVADVPEQLDDILLTALAKEKKDRYDNIVYLRDALEELYEAEMMPPSVDNW